MEKRRDIRQGKELLMGSWSSKGVDWTSVDTIRGSNAVYKELSECLGERIFAEKTTAAWAEIPHWAGGGHKLASFLSAFDYGVQGFFEQNQGYVDHLIQLPENYYHWNPGTGQVQWRWWSGQWYPAAWSNARYLEVSGDSEIIPLKSVSHGLVSASPEYLFQRRGMMNLCRWAFEMTLNVGYDSDAYPAYLAGQVECSSDFSQIRFRHPKSLVPNAWLTNGASTGKMPAHTWEVWHQQYLSLFQTYYELKTQKIYSESITSDIKSTDANYHYSPWLNVADLRASEYQHITNEWYCSSTKWTFIYKCEVDGGFGYRDW
jgi:hypothetical protein